MSIVTKNLSLLGMSVISMMSAISSLLLAVNLFSPYAFCCGEIKLCCQLINLLSLSFFTVSFMIACLCEVLNSFLSFTAQLQKTLLHCL